MIIPFYYICAMNKRDQIISAALKLLTENGVHNTPMSAIAKAVGTGMGAIYNYFPNKDILLNEVFLSIKEKEKYVFQTFDPSQPIKTQFESFFLELIQFYIKHPTEFNFLEQLQASPIITKETIKKGLEASVSLSEFLITGQEFRIIKNIKVSEMVAFIGGSALSCLRQHYRNESLSAELLDNYLKMVWDAIKE